MRTPLPRVAALTTFALALTAAAESVPALPLPAEPIPAELAPWIPQDTSAIVRVSNLESLEQRLGEILKDSYPEAASFLVNTKPSVMLPGFLAISGDAQLDKPMYAAALPDAEYRVFIQVANRTGPGIGRTPIGSFAAIEGTDWVVFSTSMEPAPTKGPPSPLMDALPSGDVALALRDPAVLSPLGVGQARVFGLPAAGLLNEVAQGSLALGLSLHGTTLQVEGRSARTPVPGEFDDAAIRGGIANLMGMGACGAAVVSPHAQRLVADAVRDTRGSGAQDELGAALEEITKRVSGPIALGVLPDAANPGMVDLVIAFPSGDPKSLLSVLGKAIDAADSVGIFESNSATNASADSEAWEILGAPIQSVAAQVAPGALIVALAPRGDLARVRATALRAASARASGATAAPEGWWNHCAAGLQADLSALSQLAARAQRASGGDRIFMLLPTAAPVPLLARVGQTGGATTFALSTDLKQAAHLWSSLQPVEPWKVLAAARSGDLESLKRYIELAPGNFDLCDPGPGPYDQSPLMAAARGGQVEAMQMLIAAGCNPAMGNSSGYCALMAACESKSADAVQYLLEQGAKADAATREGRTPLYYAARTCQAETVKLLLAAGAKVDEKVRSIPGLKGDNCAAVRTLLGIE